MRGSARTIQPPTRGVFDPNRDITCPVGSCRKPVAKEGQGEDAVNKLLATHIASQHPGWNGHS